MQDDILVAMERQLTVKKFKLKQLEAQMKSVLSIKQEPSIVSESPVPHLELTSTPLITELCPPVQKSE